MDATEEALAELQARVQRLEARLGGDEPQEQPAAAGTGGGTFWLLDALRERGLAGGAPVSWQTARLAEDLTLVAGGWLRVTARGQHQVPPERLVPLLVVLAATAGP